MYVTFSSKVQSEVEPHVSSLYSSLCVSLVYGVCASREQGVSGLGGLRGTARARSPAAGGSDLRLGKRVEKGSFRLLMVSFARPRIYRT